jgi:Tfp pilus assembly protein PilO
MKSTNRLIVSILVVTALAIAFFVLALSPKRQEASDLAGEAEQLQISLSESQANAAAAIEAKHDFPADYRQMVVLGQAVPPSDDTSSLLMELNRLAKHSRVDFDSIQLDSGSGESLPPAAPAPIAPAATVPSAEGTTPGAVPAAATVPPTEAAASLLPLGATIGTAGLGVMPYDLTFSGDFFHIADFIEGIDSLVHTGGRDVAVDGRLVTLNGFALNADPELGFPHLNATFSVTAYLMPPSQGLTAGATPVAPAPSTAVPATTTPPTAESTPVSAAE